MSRFNCRDAVWWWLKAIKEYTELAPNGFEILQFKVVRLYPTDDSEHPTDKDLKSRNGSCVVQKLADIIQEALTIHVNGLKFRERNAGLKIDEHMKDEGFNNEIGVDLETGFVFGGHELNCGTWMDKLGSSLDANNKGIPATPRDGSAVELVGLSRCVLEWLITAYSGGNYLYDGVVKIDGLKFTWTEWAEKIDQNFEKYFWVSEDSVESVHINKRGIYKDTLNSKVAWTDYQLRPNFLIAITIAPQMINKVHARIALRQIRAHLVDETNTVGIKTLDASDFNYCGDYDNANRSNDPKLAHGFNYHQGPEWLWPIGYFLRAQLIYFNRNSDEKEMSCKCVKKHLGKLSQRLNSNDWKSLPELTNRNGKECFFSCAAQAWSVATTLEVFYDLAIQKSDS